MLVNTLDFWWKFALIFLALTVILAFRRSRSGRVANYFLLAVSYAMVYFYSPMMAIVLLAVTLITYGGALIVSRRGGGKLKSAVFVLLGLLPLFAFKYYNFVNENLSAAFARIGIDTSLPGMNLAIPLGISFFSLQAIGYFLDVSRGHIKAERNLGDYMLFVAFFPQLASGPISKASDLLPQIKSERTFSYEQATSGLKWLLWGMFLKVIVADRISALIHNPLHYSYYYDEVSVTASVFLYSFQIYCDFAGYSFMALGLGRLLGLELINNFERPYFAMSVTEFWHRWHRSLSIWLKDHIYIPLGGSRCGKAHNYANIFTTFLVSGLWHGANWTFVLWGGIHGGVQVAEKRFGLNKLQSRGLVRVLRCLTTFAIVSIAWVFFAQPTAGDAIDVLGHMFSSEGQAKIDLFIPLLLVAVVLIKDIGDEFNIKNLRVLHHPLPIVRWTFYSIIMAVILIFAEGGENFIYSGF